MVIVDTALLLMQIVRRGVVQWAAPSRGVPTQESPSRETRGVGDFPYESKDGQHSDSALVCRRIMHASYRCVTARRVTLDCLRANQVIDKYEPPFRQGPFAPMHDQRIIQRRITIHNS
jgi:hypothetical protein